ncbi:hypothetical protein [Dyadobacter arcticus]|uniref:Aerotolerance regulator N-terminal domain-containing protein n=1 Tax=Dyadobacter arcticus TaxID=1078754 RepID=A0ABX0UTJ7_9BACT|nr:hypothetical protein [Dyadobacter arcticus]NIJ55040.1 hypothetical protein [Dyadobacter arcticus]
MIQFDFDWSDLLNKLILGFALAILPLQLWMMVFRNRPLGKISLSGRLMLRLLLNIMLWLSIIAFIVQPSFTRQASSRIRMLSASDVSVAFTDHLADSLKAEKATIDELEKTGADTLLIVGQNFPESLFSTLRQLEHQPIIRWVPYFADDQLQGLHWSGMVRKGEMQQVFGSIKSSQKQVIKVKYGDKTLDSIALSAGFTDFRLKFPAFTQGRTEVELTLADKTIDTLRFFSRPSEKLTVRFLLDNPDFETRNLATWLGKNGNAVKYEVKLSKDLSANENINTAKEPDIIVTDPLNASDASIKKALKNGKSVFFVNLSNVPAEVQGINAALRTKFQIKKISNEPTIRVLADLNALPYHFVRSGYQLGLQKLPVTIEKTMGNVGVSLLAETFPMQLAGDSIGYEKVWNEILALIRPVSANNVEITAPVYAGLPADISVNNFRDFKKQLLIGLDTIFVQKSFFNTKSGSAKFLPTETGWVTLRDSVPAELFVQEMGSGFDMRQMSDFVDSYQNPIHSGATNSKVLENKIHKKLPDWFWFTWLLICFTALWVEAKF